MYEARDRGRLELSASAFDDGNFSLLIRAVEETDAGLYTCNLHHHYCHLYESLAVRLEVTDGPRPPPPTGTARRRCWRWRAARPRS